MTAIERERRREGKAWRTLFFVSLINAAQSAISVVGIPSLASELSLNSGQLTSLLAALPIAAGISAVFAGPISDRIGRKPCLLLGLTLLGLSLAPHPLATEYFPLLLLRCTTGLATGILMGLPSTLLSDTFRKDRQITLSGKTLCGYAIGQTIGIPLGIWLLEWINFLSVCSIFGLSAVFCIPFAYKNLPNASQSFAPAIKAQWLKNYIKRSRETLRDKDFNLITAASFLSFTALSTFYTSFALWLFTTAKLSPTEIAPMYFSGGVLQILVFTVLLKRFTRLRPQLTIFISLILNTIIFSSAYPALESTLSATLFFALTLGAVSLRIPDLQYLINNRGDPQQKGLRVSLNQTSSHLGKALGAMLAGLLFPVMTMHHIAHCCGAITLLSSLLFLRDFMSELNAAQLKRSPKAARSNQDSEIPKIEKWSSSGTHVAN